MIGYAARALSLPQIYLSAHAHTQTQTHAHHTPAREVEGYKEVDKIQVQEMVQQRCKHTPHTHTHTHANTHHTHTHKHTAHTKKLHTQTPAREVEGWKEVDEMEVQEMVPVVDEIQVQEVVQQR